MYKRKRNDYIRQLDREITFMHEINTYIGLIWIMYAAIQYE